jgi:hypothetical protein
MKKITHVVIMNVGFLKTTLLLFLLFGYYLCSAQQADKIFIGNMHGDVPTITADTSKLSKALRRTLADGTVIQEIFIESAGGFHYLVGAGYKSNYKKIIAVQLGYDIASRTFFVGNKTTHITCASAACENCKTYKENGKIIACHCIEQNSASNHCNFNSKEQSDFFFHLQHFLHTKK